MSVRKNRQASDINFLEADVKADFYTAKKQIESAGYFIPHSKELIEARLRCSISEDNPLADNTEIRYSWTRDFSIYVPGENGIYISKSNNSPIIKNDKPWFNQKGHMWPYEQNRYDEKSMFLDEETLPQILANSILIENPKSELDVIRLEIYTNEFGKDLVTNYLFGEETAVKYGELLEQLVGRERKFIHLELEKSEKPYTRQLCLGNILTTNNIITNKCHLHGGAFGSPDARMIGLK